MAYLGGLPAVLEAFCWAWGQMVAYNAEWVGPGQYIHYEKSSYSDHAPARNALVTRFLGDWLIQLDTDHTFEPDLVARLVWAADKYNLDVISGIYQMKNPPHVPVLYQWVGPEESPGLQPTSSWDRNIKIVQIAPAGGGCLFVKRKIFDRITTELGEEPFSRIYPFSEDHSFFVRLKKLGIPAYAALHVHCHHLRIMPVTLDDMPQAGELSISKPFMVGGFL